MYHFNYGQYGKTCTPLLLAVDRGYVVIVKLLLQTEDIDGNATTDDGYTPLMWGAYIGNAKIAECLLHHPAIDINKQAPFGKETALDFAYDTRLVTHNRRKEGKWLIASMLAKRGAKTKRHCSSTVVPWSKPE